MACGSFLGAGRSGPDSGWPCILWRRSLARESQLWGWLSGARQVLRQDLHIQRIENGLEDGTPDVEYIIRGVMSGGVWIELKSAKRPARGTTCVSFRLRPAQGDWMQDRFEAGDKRSGWLLQVGSGGNRAVYYLTGKHRSALYAGVTEKELEALSALSSPHLKPHDILIEIAFIS